MDDRITRLLKCALEMELTPWPAPRRRLLAYAMAALLGHMEGLPPQEQLLLEAAAILHGHSEPQMVLTQTGVWLKEEMKRIFMLLEGKGSSPAARLLADALCEEIPVLKAYRTEADITVDAKGRGDFLTLDEAVRSVPASSRSETVIQVLGGEWERPQLPKKSRIRFVLRQGATFK